MVWIAGQASVVGTMLYVYLDHLVCQQVVGEPGPDAEDCGEHQQSLVEAAGHHHPPHHHIL